MHLEFPKKSNYLTEINYAFFRLLLLLLGQVISVHVDEVITEKHVTPARVLCNVLITQTFIGIIDVITLYLQFHPKVNRDMIALYYIQMSQLNVHRVPPVIIHGIINFKNTIQAGDTTFSQLCVVFGLIWNQV